jgi:hypothetical protein
MFTTTRPAPLDALEALSDRPMNNCPGGGGANLGDSLEHP